MFYLDAIDRSWGGKLGLAIASLCAIAFSTNSANAQITPDGTLPHNSRVITQDNLTTIEAGTIQENNLFHSFKDFSVPTGSTADFNNAPDIQNIISRVTGGSRSNIDGLIRAKGTANLFLLNPNGIIFGPNAQLNIGGSFLASTANSLKFADGIEFSATAPQTKPLLTVSVPIGLQYGRNAGSVKVQKSILEVAPGKTLALIGGNVQLDGGQLLAPGGNVELASVAGENTVGLFGKHSYLGLSFPVGVPQGDISITNGAFVDVTAGGDGSIAINAQNIDLIGGSALVAGIAPGLGSVGSKAGNIEIHTTKAINIDQSFIGNQVYLDSVGNGGNINITAGSLSVTNGAQLSASTFGQGDAGRVFVQANNAVSLVNGDIFSTVASKEAVGNSGGINITAESLSLSDSAQLITSTFGLGNAGNMTLQVKDAISFDGISSNQISSGIRSTVERGAIGNGGDISIKAGSLFLTNGSQLQNLVRAASNTLPGGRGNAGNTIIGVHNTITIAGVNNRGFGSGIRSNVENGAVGNGGGINIKAQSLFMSDGAELTAGIGGQEGKGGNIFVHSEDAVFLSGITTIFNTVRSGAVGDAGNITIKAGSLSLTDGAQVTTSTFGHGNAGNVNIEVRNIVTVDGEKNGNLSGVFSAVADTAEGNGGNINIKAKSISLTNGARLSARTLGQGDAGNIRVNTADFVSLFGVSSTGFSSALVTSTAPEAKGQGGEITVNTAALRVQDKAVVNAQTLNSRNGGSITIHANTFEAVNGGQVLTITRSAGKAGNIAINATDSVTLFGKDNTFTNQFAQFSQQVVSNEGSASGLFANTSENSTGQGGDLTVKTGQLIVQDGAQVTVSSRGLGDAGDIQDITARSVYLDNGSITATSTSGQGGNINNINVQDLLLLRKHSQISTTAGTQQSGGGNGGNIKINAGFIVAVPSENSDISANAFSGSGGTVAINATNIFGMVVRSREDLVRLLSTNDPIQLDTQKLPTSDISAISQASPTLSGQVNINTPDVDPSRGLAELPAEVVDASGLIAQGCAAQNGKIASQFTITGRGGLPPNPSELLSSDAVWEDARRPSVIANRQNLKTATQPAEASAGVEIVPATSWRFNKKGEVVLTAQATTTPQTFTSNSTTCRVP